MTPDSRLPTDKELYPEIEPFQVHRLEAGGLHNLYLEECGNPAGIPVLFLHGGPGSGCNENHRRYFDPDRYRIVIFDQRGCHRSTPQGETQHNTTQDLIRDIEQIRQHLAIEKWLVFGGSWGAALGLLYAEAHPHRATGMVLRGTFLARQRDLDWFARAGAGRIFPDHWQDFIAPIPEPERNDLIQAYYTRVHGDDRRQQREAAGAWSRWAGRVVTYLLPQSPPDEEDVEKMLHEVSIETHYARHAYFIEEDQILRDAGRIPDVPITIIHGRRDLTCTLDASWELHRAVPGSELVIVNEGGHLAGEAVMIGALVKATDDMAGRLA